MSVRVAVARACGRGAALGLMLGAPLPSQVAWSQVGVPAVPTWAPLAYDSARDRVVGYVSSFVGVVEFDGVSWRTVTPSALPQTGVRRIVYDPRRQQTVILPLGSAETWEWDGTTMSLRSTTLPVFGGALAFHEGRGRVMMFGGVDGSNAPQNDLWEWDGTQWLLVPTPPAGRPPVGSVTNYMIYSSMTYDARRDRLVVVGATVPARPGYIATTWEWDAQAGWSQQSPTVGGAVFDASRGIVVVLGGSSSVLSIQELDGTGQWIQRASTFVLPVGVGSASPTYDSRRGRVLWMLTDGTLWSYHPVEPARYDAHGPGCAGSLGTPALAPARPWTLPWLGETLTVTVDRLPLQLAFLAMGFDDRTVGSQPLPLDLGALGMPGCLLHIAPEAGVLLGPANPATHRLAVPNDLGLSGVRFFQQALVLDPAVNAVGLTVSGSMLGVVGRR